MNNYSQHRYALAGILTSLGIVLGLNFDLLSRSHGSLSDRADGLVRAAIDESALQQNAAQAKPLPSGSVGKNGIVVTTQHEASQIGLSILKQGGNAIDAAVAVGYALAVSDPCCGNIGGGGFMLIRFANGRQTFLNFREKAPLAATANLYLDSQGKVIPGLSTKGYRAVAVPGTVKGLETALKQYGTMPRQKLIAPAIALAEKGFILRQGDVEFLNEGIPKLKDQPNMAQIFLKSGTVPYKVGDRWVQKNLAQTLKLISRQGSDAFYQGAIATKLVTASQKNGGILTKADLARYQVVETQPLSCTYRGYEVLSSPPPGGGTTLCQMLNILEGYPLKKLGLRSKESLHDLFSAMLFAYSDRNTYLGDPAFVENPVDRLLSKGYAATIRAKIPPDRAIPPESVYSGAPVPEGTHTTHYSILDREGNSVAVTYTLNTHFGAAVMAGDTGFVLNNEMDDFTAKPGVPNTFGLVQGKTNAIAPGKQPLSSMSPTIVTKDGKVVLITGSPGGSTIPTTVLQVITNVIDYGMTIHEAVSAPRIHYQGLPNQVGAEPNALRPLVMLNLSKMGYQITTRSRWGAAASVWVDPKTGLKWGDNDNRRSAGQAIAY
jgi:gamma-glutamyltranspeptidase/glutathione hydrolase